MAAVNVAGVRLVHPASGRVLAERLEVPRTAFGRGLGLMFRRGLEPGTGMWIRPCNGIHMFFMRFAIDAIFLDSGDNVRKVYRRLRPWIGIVPLVWGAKGVVELPAGACDGLELRRGEPLRFE
jgi:uncharacterized membrane protein (UPF0127 family)